MAHLASSSGAPASDRPAPFTLREAGGTLVLALSPGASFDVLRGAMRAELGPSKDAQKGVSVRLDLGKRDIDLFELRRLVHFAKDELGMNVVGLHCTVETLQRQAERELKIKVYITPNEPAQAEVVPAPEPSPTPTPTEVAPPEPPAPPAAAAPPPADLPAVEPPRDPSPPEDEPAGGGRLLTIPNTVRSGAVVRFPGDIQVFGDVNPGAQVIAGGNVVVCGALKGLAHAGARGDDRAFILAFDMRPTQVRIGKAIQLSAAPPEQAGRTPSPEIAWISGGDIVIEPYRGRLPPLGGGAASATKESS
jgi:septum site-determining protein MinC